MTKTNGRKLDDLIAEMEHTLASLKAQRDADTDWRARLEAAKRRRTFRLIRGGAAAFVLLAGGAAWRQALRLLSAYPAATLAGTLAVGTAIGAGGTLGANALTTDGDSAPVVTAPAPTRRHRPSRKPETSPSPEPTASMPITPKPSAPEPSTPISLAPSVTIAPPRPHVHVPPGHAKTSIPAAAPTRTPLGHVRPHPPHPTPRRRGHRHRRHRLTRIDLLIYPPF